MPRFLPPLLLAAALLHGAGPSELVLEDRAARLVLRSAPSWHIASLRFPATTFRVEPAEPLPLYQLEWYENGSLTTVNSFQAKALGARKTRDTLAIRFAHEAQKLEVECRVWTASDGLHWDASFRNASPAGRPAIFRYPGMGIPSSVGSLEAVVSVADGIRIRDVFAKMKEDESREWDYPGMLSAQMTAWHDRTGGAVLYAADSAGHFKRFRMLRHRDHIVPTFEHILVGFREPAFAMPYRTVVAPFRGGWEAAADVYRDWAVKQPWCRKTLSERALPAAVAQPSFVLCSHVRLHSGQKVTDESPAIPRLGEAYRRALGLPITHLLFSWEKHGPWVAPDYFPPYPSREGFDRMSRAIHAAGDRTMIYLSGLNVTLEKTPRHGAPAFRLPDSAREALEASVIVGRDGRPLAQGTAKEGVGRKWILCPTTRAAADQVLDGVQKALDLGVDLIQVDQVVGGGLPPCFRESHGHPLAGHNHMARGFADILRRARGMTSAKGAALSLEEPGEYFIPHLDIVHAREHMEGAWPREGKGVEGIPLFSYLYHDYLLGYGGDAQLLPGSGNVGMAVYAQAANLVAGRYPAGALWMRKPDFAQASPELRKVLVEIAAIWRGEAKDFLMKGQARRLPQAFPEHPISYDFLGHRHTFRAPVLLSMSYRLGGREIALFVNTTLADQPLDLRLLAGSKDLAAIWPADLAGKPVDASKPMTVGGHRVLILRRGL